MPNKPYLRFFTRITRISPPFNAGNVVEIKFEMDRDWLPGGAELCLRVPVDHKEHYHVGDEYAIRLYKV